MANTKYEGQAFYNAPFVVNSFKEMPYRVLGKSGLKVSDIGLGTWKMGYPESGDGSRIDEKSSFKIFDRALELGVTFWDTANRYNNASGNSERIIGKWFKKNPDQRRNVVLATKMAGTMDGLSPNHCGLSRGNIMEAVYASLERLQTDHIDLLYFHRFDGITPPEESLIAIEDLVKQDLIRYFAVSNASVEILKTFQAVQSQMSVRSRILAVQNQFDLLDGEAAEDRGVLNYATEQGISFIGWSPMARGLLTNRYLNPVNAGPGDRLFDEGDLKAKISPENMGKLHALAAVSDEMGVELSQLVMAYMLTMKGMGPIIPSSSSVKQLESNAAAGKIVLSEEQIEKVKAIVKY
ncbi:aldo/keto reductase [Daejeonella sp. H1SJ63]|jgi:aryl-alcohol dehydrogenase-like predicted oxidoreductase|uniref:aldo/keto reductase n=1 Tax=Daejeonella sp. H1SJ63 TaxID=3034145 RepID=UPI0023EB8291|nr:aldo/keto reductase [Daejeonella sp. H1SJ63]